MVRAPEKGFENILTFELHPEFYVSGINFEKT